MLKDCDLLRRKEEEDSSNQGWSADQLGRLRRQVRIQVYGKAACKGHSMSLERMTCHSSLNACFDQDLS